MDDEQRAALQSLLDEAEMEFHEIQMEFSKTGNDRSEDMEEIEADIHSYVDGLLAAKDAEISEHKQALLHALKVRDVEERNAERMTASLDIHQTPNWIAHQLSQMSPEDRREAIGKARAWAEKCVYAPDDDQAQRLAQEVSQLNGYGLGAFMQHLMKFGAQK